MKKAWRNVKKYGRQIVVIAAAIYTGGATLAAGWGAWASGAAAGFVGGAIGTGSLKGAIQGAVLGAATAGIANHIGYGNSAFTKWAQKDLYNKAIAHGLSQGAISQISGGNFKSGFISGSISSLSGSYMEGNRGESLGIGGRTAVAATAGGIAAELGGGKFANGARSAAFVHLFNAENLAEKWQCMGECHGTGYGDINFMPEIEQRALAGDVALGLATLPVGGGVAALSKAGYALKVWRYKNIGGIGINILKNGSRRLGVDIHKINYQGIDKIKLHYHRRPGIGKHRPYEGGW
ncbi:Rhs family protein [uncultured Candidatus Thioglobus sp.]|nr:Rhs family protein [uncultured Candidatus Thioglobus sp.]